MRECKHIEIKSKSDCTGCRACEQICPVKCIKMEENEEGFLYPKIDEERCINCGKCKKTCPQLMQTISENKYKIYGVRPREIDIAKKSTSGGIAYLISRKIIEEKGIVVGCCYDENLYAHHVCVDNMKDLEKLRGSKYVTTDTQNTFSEVKAFLECGRKVLYTGSSCQIAGIKKFLGKEYDNLITIDIVCHGVPSNKIFRKYLDWLERKYNKKITDYSFRNKDKGAWGLGYIARIQFEDGTIIYKKADFDPYYTAFLAGKNFRESCYQCKYANINRVGDISLADFWGIEKCDRNMYNKSGVSLVIVNNNKGQMQIDKLVKEENIIINEYTVREATEYNLNLKEPTHRDKFRDEIYIKLEEMDFEEYSKKYLLPKGKKIKAYMKNSIPLSLKLLYKKYIK